MRRSITNSVVQPYPLFHQIFASGGLARLLQTFSENSLLLVPHASAKAEPRGGHYPTLDKNSVRRKCHRKFRCAYLRSAGKEGSSRGSEDSKEITISGEKVQKEGFTEDLCTLFLTPIDGGPVSPLC